uniref:Alpha-type protein kinase domain-containing protein n=1 Tax=Rhizophagus irregularis (strain DAOM 181602 / DAOM 197198 / MUCL 43194) TaxID=747089 RepID=U9UKU7_RHIID
MIIQNENTYSSDTSSTSSIPPSLINELNRLNFNEERLKRYADESINLISNNKENELRTKTTFLREMAISEILNNIKLSMKVDLCFVLDCTDSMRYHIAAAKDCIFKVTNYIKHTNPSIELWVGFCGYRDHNDGSSRLQIFDFNDQYDQFVQYMLNVTPSSSSDNDIPEDVLGGLNAAITKMNWKNDTRILLHIGDNPPHGGNFTNLTDNYPNGDPYGLTAENVLEKMKSKSILYFFGKITNETDKMLKIFSGIIGEIPVFDLMEDDSIKLFEKFIKFVSSSITTSVTLVSVIGSNSKDIYALQQRKLNMNPNEPNWDNLKLQKGNLLWYYCIPKTLDDLKNPGYFNKSNLSYKSFTFKIASQPFSAGAEKYAYFARDIKSKPEKEIVMKEYLKVGRNKSFERYLEAVEVSTVAHFLSTKFNLIAEKKNISKVNFLEVKLLRVCNRYYTIEPKLNAEYKRFNSNTGVISKLRHTLEAFAHFTYEYTKGYLVVCDLQGIEITDKLLTFQGIEVVTDEFLLTDPAIHCINPLRFGGTNIGKKGINELFLANHRCNDICKKLKLSHVQ